MRILVVFVLSISSLFLQGQAQAPGARDSSSLLHKQQSRKWFLTSYSGVGVGFNFFNRSTATILSAPVGLQLNRQLNNNFYAFAGISAAPSYITFNQSFLSPGIIKPYAGNSFRPGFPGLTSSVNLGLMYVNDARTFSVSGSIGVERGSYPVLLYPAANAQKRNTFTPGYR